MISTWVGDVEFGHKFCTYGYVNSSMALWIKLVEKTRTLIVCSCERDVVAPRLPLVQVNQGAGQ